MIILPLKLYFAVISGVTKLRQGGESHVLALPNAVEAIVFLSWHDLDPVVALVPCHTDLLEIVEEID